MYRHCIFCSANLGINAALEAFPVGRLVAFDAARGRLWAVCPRCYRWNLAPLEERWETVEVAEQQFRESRLRVHSENVGLCKLADGTRLVRVGSALPRELAAWRYGDHLTGRRRKYLVAAGVASAAMPLHLLFSATGSALALGAYFVAGATMLARGVRGELARTRRPVQYFPPGEFIGGEAFLLRAAHLHATTLHASERPGELALHVRDFGLPLAFTRDRALESGRTLVLPDGPARHVLRRAAVHMNARGAGLRRVDEAVAQIADSGGADAFLWDRARAGESLLPPGEGAPSLFDFGQSTPGALALEMALRDEEERRAMDGELAMLESAWREAESIAAIADALPGPAEG